MHKTPFLWTRAGHFKKKQERWVFLPIKHRSVGMTDCRHYGKLHRRCLPFNFQGCRTRCLPIIGSCSEFNGALVPSRRTLFILPGHKQQQHLFPTQTGHPDHWPEELKPPRMEEKLTRTQKSQLKVISHVKFLASPPPPPHRPPQKGIASVSKYATGI